MRTESDAPTKIFLFLEIIKKKRKAQKAAIFDLKLS